MKSLLRHGPLRVSWPPLLPALFPSLCRALLALPLLLASGAAPAQIALGGSPVVQTEQVRAELIAHAPQGVEAGKPVWVGLQLTHQPDWHTYWKNPGDSGLATQLAWSLPAGVEAGDIQWPLPRKIPIGNLANYGYEGTVLLPVQLNVPPGYSQNQLPVRLKAQWLVCRRECIPQEGDFSLSIPVRSSTALQGAAFDAAAAAHPKAQGTGRIEVGADALQLRVSGLPAALQGKALEFFPEAGSLIQTAAAGTQTWQGSEWQLRVPLSPERSESPASVAFVLAGGTAAQRQGYRLVAAVQGAWPALAAPPVNAALEATLRAAAQARATPAPGSDLSLLAALLGALVGGMILNLMPCVFPILALKVLNFTRHAEDRRAHRISGLAYSAGVLMSFLAMGGLVLALRAGGESLGWGFQLQSPAMVSALALLFTLMGLNLAGVYEFGSLLPQRVACMRAESPLLDSLLSGVLAVAVAAPCTAPFMGASLGLALSLPALQALLVFAALGVGMALPYLLASLLPAVARALPRPGPWMQSFRTLMAFPMFGTVVWLIWILGQQVGIDGATALLGALVLLGALTWSLRLQGLPRALLAGLCGLLVAGALWTLGQDIARGPQAGAPAQAEGDWQPWAPARVEQLLASGRPVFVDFTAAWCVTCQINKRTTLADERVVGDLRSKQVSLLRADWTRRDPAITEALGRLGRNGVPVYVLYQAGRPPQLLSEVLSVAEVRAALAQL